MKALKHIILLLLGVPAALQAQESVPGAYPFNQYNYVRTWEAKAPFGNSDSVKRAAPRQVKTSTVYLDGLGRVIQEVVKKGSQPYNDTATDLVKAYLFDKEGRKSLEYLPFRSVDRGIGEDANDGSFKRDPFLQQQQFYNGRFPAPASQDAAWGYNKITYEASTLDRVVSSLPSGKAWVGSGRGIGSNYWINSDADSVQIWICTDSAGKLGSYQTVGRFPAGSLYKNVTTDENGRQTIEFRDEVGNMLLRKVQYAAAADTGTGSGHTGWACTYFIYDEVDNLRAVIQPKGVELLIANSWNVNALGGDIAHHQMFRYEYDRRNRPIRKKDPGVAELYLVYDQRGRIVMTQDGNLRAAAVKKWHYYTYDSLGREIATGLLDNANDLNYHGPLAYKTVNYPVLSPGTFEEWTLNHYDDYQNLPAGLSSSLSTSDVSSASINQNYYLAPDYPEPLTADPYPFGSITWSKTKVLGTGDYISNVKIFDTKKRVQQEKTINVSGGLSVVTFQYNFTGQIIRSIHRHTKAGDNGLIKRIFSYNTYDDLGRIIKEEVKLDFTSQTLRPVVQYGYDELGQLKIRKLGKDPVTGQPVETQVYDYNARGWLQGVNREFAKDTTNRGAYFGYELAYDQATTVVNGVSQAYSSPTYNGSIAAMLWKTAGDNKVRKYDYSYDPLNRLTGAAFSQFTGSSFSHAAGLDFSADFSYDINGNLQKLNQKGWKGTASGIIDSLSYYYRSNSNQLLTVVDQVNDTATKLGDFRSSKAYITALGGTKTSAAQDYDYDQNGNLRFDKNKDIGRIAYNYLNKPDTVFFPGKGLIAYRYDAAGNKVRKTTIDSTTSPVRKTTTIYVENHVYESVEHNPADETDKLEEFSYFTHNDGIVRFDYIDGYSYDYFLKDHLGNVRMVVTDKVKTDAYPDLSFEGSPGSVQINNQDLFYEKADGSSINVTGSRIARPGGFGDTIANGHFATLVRRSTGAFGAGKLLKVMAGKNGQERIHTSVQYYFTAANANNTGSNPLASFLTSFATALAGGGGVSDLLKQNASAVASTVAADPGLATLLNTSPATSGSNSAPKAYLHVLMFDEQFKLNVNASRVVPVAYTPNVPGTIDLRLGNAVAVPQNGYCYIYFSNESDELVYFDNFTLSHQRGPVKEENHYYPYGLSIAALSTKAVGSLQHGIGFNSKEKQAGEFSNGSGLDWYDYDARMYDPQIGRFFTTDPNAGKYPWITPYNYGFNCPTQVVDPTGMDGVVTGSGSQSDPYVVRANYYMYNMSEAAQQVFKAALAQYNNNGEAFEVQTENGTVYVKFDLRTEESTDKESAVKSAEKDVIDEGGLRIRYGNTVTVGAVDDALAGNPSQKVYGVTNSRDIILDQDDIAAAAKERPGTDMIALGVTNAVHEIGHNLGAAHGDPGCMMNNLDWVELKDKRGNGTGKYAAFFNKVDVDGVRAIAGRIDLLRNGVSKYLSQAEEAAVIEKKRAGWLRRTKKRDF